MMEATRREFVKGVLGVFVASQIPFAPTRYETAREAVVEYSTTFKGRARWLTAVHLVDEGWVMMPTTAVTESVERGVYRLTIESSPLVATRDWVIDRHAVFRDGELFYERPVIVPLRLVVGDSVSIVQPMEIR